MFSVTRLGYFKSSFYNFFTKVAQKYATFWAFEENIHIQVKTVVTTLLGATFGEKIGLLFISTPGHTAIMFSTPWTTLFCKLHLLPPYMALFLSMFPSFCVYLTANVYKLSPFSLSFSHSFRHRSQEVKSGFVTRIPILFGDWKTKENN